MTARCEPSSVDAELNELDPVWSEARLIGRARSAQCDRRSGRLDQRSAGMTSAANNSRPDRSYAASGE